jgi:hypothetical protein
MAWGCSSRPCNEDDPCPVVDEPAGADDYVYAFDPGTLVELIMGGGKYSVQELAGGEAITGPISCDPSSYACTVRIKRLQLKIITFELDYTGGSGGSGKATVENATISLEAPFSIAGSGDWSAGSFSVASGISAHTCATINGHAFHASAPVDSDAGPVLYLDPVSATATFDGQVPIVVRTDDKGCTRVTYGMGLLASARLVSSPDAGADAPSD